MSCCFLDYRIIARLNPIRLRTFRNYVFASRPNIYEAKRPDSCIQCRECVRVAEWHWWGANASLSCWNSEAQWPLKNRSWTQEQDHDWGEWTHEGVWGKWFEKQRAELYKELHICLLACYGKILKEKEQVFVSLYFRSWFRQVTFRDSLIATCSFGHWRWLSIWVI